MKTLNPKPQTLNPKPLKDSDEGSFQGSLRGAWGLRAQPLGFRFRGSWSLERQTAIPESSPNPKP